MGTGPRSTGPGPATWTELRIAVGLLLALIGVLVAVFYTWLAVGLGLCGGDAPLSDERDRWCDEWQSRLLLFTNVPALALWLGSAFLSVRWLTVRRHGVWALALAFAAPLWPLAVIHLLSAPG